MEKIISPTLKIGLLILVIITGFERYIMPISDWISIPIMILAIILIIVGGLKKKYNA